MTDPFAVQQPWQGPQPATFAQPPPRRGGSDLVNLIHRLLRVLWAIVMLGLLIFVWVSMSPGERPSAPGSWGSALSRAESNYDANNARISGAPQQQVVNGWYANDLATIHADQLSAQLEQYAYSAASSDRIAALTGVLALTVIGEVALRAIPGRPRSS